MGSQGSKMQGNILDVTLEIRASVQTWSSHILESRLLLVDRCLKNTFFFLAFHSLKENGFPAFCVLRVTHYFKILA